jgi:hypothetical protein
VTIELGKRMVAKVILAIAAAAFVGALSGSTDVWARGGKSGHGGGMRSAWMGKNTHGVHGKFGRRHFPGQMHRSHGHDQHKKKQQHRHDFAQGVWHKASGKQSDFRRNWQGGGSSGGGGGRLRRERRGRLHKLAILPGRLVPGDEITDFL